ncbi:MAG TPA: NAD(P)/FAD-dependent oxidoreductase [Rubricoccaceae bacterium]|nr:NAD(P)/FAD-dependent oxidoreductase [Rubricoccaceae bacterium]
MYDAVIVGAGPGGSTAAAVMARQGLRVLLLDKDTFPRDKTCGDALSGKTVDVMKRLGMIEPLLQATQIDSWGVTFSGPYGDEAAIPFTKALDKPIAPGFVCDRVTFDKLVFDQAVAAGAEIWTGATCTGLLREGEKVVGVKVKRNGTEEEVRAPLTVGADGAYSVVVRELGMDQLEEQHYCAGLRWYWRGVTGFHARNHIEIHFVEESIPGYFWIFPMANGLANVGLGMLSSEVKKRDLKLKPLLEQLVQHPRFKERFAQAEPVDKIRGWGLPLGSKPRRLAGDGWLLVGDAGSLIDPFTGEGIGNAMVSAEKAAEWAGKAKEANDFSAAFLAGYGEDVLSYLGHELRLSHAMQRLGRWKWLLNTVIRKASRSPEVADAISMMFDDESEREKLVSPLFYLRLLAA